MRHGIATVSLSGALEDKLPVIAAAGFHEIELFEPDLVSCPAGPEEIASLVGGLGLRISLYQPFRDFEAVPETVLTGNLRRAEAVFALMARLRTSTLLVCSSVSPEAVDDDDLAAEHLALLADRAAERGITIAYEALAWGRHVNTAAHAWEIVRRAGRPNLGVGLDSFHSLSRGESLADIARIPGERIAYLQLADAPHMSLDVLQWSRHHRCFPGQGSLDVAGFARTALAAGYDGPLSLEVFNDVFRQSDPERVAVDARRSLIALEEQVRTRALPPAPALQGLNWVEIAVDADSVQAVEDLLTALGFRRSGPHRSKPVHLWARGDLRIVLDHGLRLEDADAQITALGIESTDPTASVRRALELRAPRLPRRRGAGEADLSAIAAPDGTSLFFSRTDRSGATGWLADFLLLEPEQGTPSRRGVQGIDHVGLSLPVDAFEEAGLFYGSVLALEAAPTLELAGPDGLVRGIGLSDAEGGIRLALTVPLRPSPDGSTLDDLQHVAFTTDDVLAVAADLRALGVPLLAIPRNYYADVAARTDLDPGFVADLQAAQVLYERSADGELLQLYTGLLGGRLFVEIVERRGRYAGFGAANSAVRLAAQHRERHRARPHHQQEAAT